MRDLKKQLPIADVNISLVISKMEILTYWSFLFIAKQIFKELFGFLACKHLK
jgi:hypothetical protein